MRKIHSYRRHACHLASMLFVPLALSAATIATSTASHAYDSRIVGGNDINIEQASGIVALLDTHMIEQGFSFQESQFCAGTVIDARWILTAAHCVVNTGFFGDDLSPADISIMMGSANLDSPVNSPVNVVEIIAHENYTNVEGGDDIALLRLNVDALTAPVDLNTQPVLQDQRVFIAGWGYQFSGGDTVPRLQGAFVDATPGDICATRFPDLDGVPDADTICAGVPQGGIDACQGDSGGPLYRITGNDLPVTAVAGITSWGDGCANVGRPGVYTNVAAYTDWIRVNSGIDAGQPPGDGGAGGSDITGQRYSQTAGEIFWDKGSYVTFRVYRNGVVLTDKDGSSVYDPTLTAGQSYQYVVKALASNGAEINWGSITLGSAQGAYTGTSGGNGPDTPDDGGPGDTGGSDLTGQRYSQTAGEIFWDKGSYVTFRVYRNGVALTNKNGSSFFDPTLTAGQSYQYVVKALASNGAEVDWGSVTLGSAQGTYTGTSGGNGPDTPDDGGPVDTGGGNLTGQRYSQTAAEIFWDKGSYIMFRVYRNGVVLTNKDASSVFDPTLTAGQSYQYVVKALASNGAEIDWGSITIGAQQGAYSSN